MLRLFSSCYSALLQTLWLPVVFVQRRNHSGYRGKDSSEAMESEGCPETEDPMTRASRPSNGEISLKEDNQDKGEDSLVGAKQDAKRPSTIVVDSEHERAQTPKILISNSLSRNIEAPLIPEVKCGGLSSPVTPSASHLGRILLTVRYNERKKVLLVTIVEGIGLELLDKDSSCQICATLLPNKTSSYRTKCVAGGSNPKFNETFVFSNLSQEELSRTFVCFRVYKHFESTRRSSSSLFVGETTLINSLIDARGGILTHHTLTLHPEADNNLNLSPSPMGSRSNSVSRRSSMVDESGRFCAQPISDNGPELLISLCCNEGHVVVGVERGAAFVQNTKNPDTFIRVTACTMYGKQIGEHRTEVVRSSAEPVYGDAFVFKISEAELESISILIRVYGIMGMWRKKVQLGWISLGENSSTEDEQEHWHEMIQGMGTTVSKWHHLMIA